MNIIIKEISALETHKVRQPVLRKGLPASTCMFKGDELDTTFHLGAFDDEDLVGVATFLKKDKSPIQELFELPKSMYQLRGMGVLKTHQGMGVGKLLLHAAERRLREINIDVLWFHARTSAVDFYKRMGYTTVGTEIQLEPAGPHFKMYREL
ncbi:MAG: GNAT family N-acetyltransferase [Nonlabens sp.]